MKGFDTKFSDFPDYIIGITKEIWEDRGIATLHNYYAPDIIVRSPSSVVVGNQNVIGATMATLAEFPDRTLFGEDVIWSGTPEDGMLSSHRLHSTATHANPGVYGAPTGKKLHYRIIADCHAKNNQIDDEWLIRDQGAIVRQLGIDPRDYARDLIEREGGFENCVTPFTPANDVVGPYKGTGNDNEWGQRFADIVTRMMTADFTVIPNEYDRAANLEYAPCPMTALINSGWGYAQPFLTRNSKSTTKLDVMTLICHHVRHCVGHCMANTKVGAALAHPQGPRYSSLAPAMQNLAP